MIIPQIKCTTKSVCEFFFSMNKCTLRRRYKKFWKTFEFWLRYDESTESKAQHERSRWAVPELNKASHMIELLADDPAKHCRDIFSLSDG